MIGEKVFPLGGVRKLFTMSGHLLDDSKDLQDNHFYVAVGLETFKHFPYWRSPGVPSEVRQRYIDLEKCPQKKKKAESKESPKHDNIPPETKDSVYHAKEGRKKTPVEPFTPSGAEGDVYKARTPAKDAQGALEVKEDLDVKVEVPVDQAPAEVVKEVDDACDSSPKFGGIKVSCSDLVSAGPAQRLLPGARQEVEVEAAVGSPWWVTGFWSSPDRRGPDFALQTDHYAAVALGFYLALENPQAYAYQRTLQCFGRCLELGTTAFVCGPSTDGA
ncbi:Doublecortin domain-containing protein 2C [Fukomys damarensis]|uniref:Doublecortin domain-containing protein 2C n=1 Tax=Fukomys damarensis TaxID=885580 RepID=A0A091E7Y1_FUKDA|nr:Doublecortin domain-containing protein 2C [Fukomys damarensis]